MSEPEDATIDDVMVPHEQATPDHHAHAKTPKHVDDDLLAERTEEEREEVHDEQRDAGSSD